MSLETEDILNRFQQWLAQTNQELERLAEPPPAADAPSPPVGLLPLIEAFTALRHELKLQTKSARGLEELLQTALGGLERAIDQLRSVQPQESAAAEQAARPLVESLIELDEALRRGETAAAATRRRLLEETPRRLAESLQQRFKQLSAWQRWRSRPWQAEVLQFCRRQLAETQTPALSSLGEGYQLICARLQRMLREHRIERLACVGRRVDPTRMKVIELVDAPGASPETVVDELRPGYEWRGQVVRYAEVRATRAAVPVSGDSGAGPDADAGWRLPAGENGTNAVSEKETCDGYDYRD